MEAITAAAQSLLMYPNVRNNYALTNEERTLITTLSAAISAVVGNLPDSATPVPGTTNVNRHSGASREDQLQATPSGAGPTSRPDVYRISTRPSSTPASTSFTTYNAASPSSAASVTSDAASRTPLNTPVQNYSATGYACRSQIPGSVLQHVQFDEQKCFDVTSRLCKDLVELSGCSRAALAQMNITKFDDVRTRNMGGTSLFKIVPIAGMKKLALIIERKRIAIPQCILDLFKWLLDHRVKKTARFLRLPTRPRSALDTENKMHVYFNDSLREVYKILCRLPHRAPWPEELVSCTTSTS